ncbi:hypothetical protein ITJ86_01395 [Winogradskyella sp. F6397]|uniref:Uncharacterized protein n=1 Tax=Winogradskyella marina TaxID=2785530 RepID=A0ABS0EED2_9FLAO|nr:hypothetical protein [Winogradskyella marina]MBF8148531.1 hypothetical protein [Winogradskyella marina]
MGTGLFIIDAIIIAIVILPFVLFINGRKKRQKKLQKALQSEASLHNCKLSKVETHSNFAIGIDSSEQKLFFYKETEEAAYAQTVDLKSISACKSIKEYKQAKGNAKPNNVIDKIQLSFIHRNQKDATHLVLYNNNDEMTLNNELVVAQKWQDYITEFLESKVEVQTSETSKHVATA